MQWRGVASQELGYKGDTGGGGGDIKWMTYLCLPVIGPRVAWRELPELHPCC